MNLSEPELEIIEDYLISEELIKNHLGSARGLAITHDGVKTVEAYGGQQSEVSIFISHVSEERLIARYLKELLFEVFAGKISVFVSSDLHSITNGKEWFKEIKDNLQRSEYVLVLCSDRSILQPWINFEAGAAHILDKHVVPVCYHGITIGELPQPLSNLQAVEANNLPNLKSLIEQIGRTFNIIPKTVVINQSPFFQFVISDPKLGFFLVSFQNGGVYQRGDVLEILGDIYPSKNEDITIQIFGPNSLEDRVNTEKITYYDGRILYQYETYNLKEGDYFISFTLPSGRTNKLSFHIDEG